MTSRQQRRHEERKGVSPPPIKSKELLEKIDPGFVDPTDHALWGGKLNIYTCQRCRGHIVTRDIAEGVTPFMLPSYEFCPNKCGGRGDRVTMQSSMYRVWNQSMREDYQWYRPTEGEAYDPAYRDHVKQGGLIIRPAPEPAL